MSDLVLRGLLLPDSRKQVSSTSNVKNNDSILKGLQLEQNETAQSLSIADYLKLSDNSTSSRTSKGSVPIQLMSPNEITSNKPQSVISSKYNDLISGVQTSKPTKQQPKLNGLQRPTTNSNTYTTTTTATYSQTSPNTKITSSYSTTMTGNVGGVSQAEKLNSKISDAIEKIKTWDRKIGILDAEINKQNVTGDVDNGKIISRTSQTVTAKKDAVASRMQALSAYSDVLNDVKGIDLNSNEFSQTKNLYLTMESNFSAASVKDDTMMEKVKGFLKATMTADNFNKALTYLNPFN